jgi:hypothetical protein
MGVASVIVVLVHLPWADNCNCPEALLGQKIMIQRHTIFKESIMYL